MSFWKSRWRNGQTGWHNSDTNEHLQNHHQILFQHDSPTIFVPLCGQSLDMAWLNQQGASIIGVDLVRQPLEQYFDEQKLTPRSQIAKAPSWSASRERELGNTSHQSAA